LAAWVVWFPAAGRLAVLVEQLLDVRLAQVA
jgi:hypothetical protein